VAETVGSVTTAAVGEEGMTKGGTAKTVYGLTARRIDKKEQIMRNFP
jgi:hypothetical protein